MSELRTDPTSGRLVIVAPGRKARPTDEPAPPAPPAPVALDPDCPFCPGSEAQLPAILEEVDAKAAPGWRVRVVPNRYPAVDSLDAAPPADCDPPGAAGIHEVIIESPRHDADLATMDGAQVEAVVRTYRDRSRRLLARAGVAAVVLFRNHGPGSGASLRHPHAQILALNLTPPLAQALAEAGRARHRATGRCPTCEMIEAERAAGVRIVEETGRYLALTPFAAEHPGEVWILPREHRATFAQLEDEGLPEFAHLLKRTLARIGGAYGDPSYSFVFDGADRTRRSAPYVHWRLRIAPRLADPGGFELGAGMAINPSSPEADAQRLRQAGGGGA